MTNEFKKISMGIDTRYVLETATGGGTSAGSVASVSMPMGGTRKRGDNLLAQEGDKKTVPATTPRNFVAKNAKSSGAGAHKDKKKAAKQGQEKHKKPFMEDHSTATGGWGQGSYNTYTAGNHGRGVAEQGDVEQELGMAGSELYGIAKHAKELLALIQQHSDEQGLEAWQQSKITKAADYLNAVLQSIDYDTNVDQGVAEALTYPQKHSSWSVRSPKKNEFNTRYKLDQEPEARAHAERIGGKLVKVDQRGHAIRTGSKGDKGVAEGWDDIKKFGKKAAVASAIGLGIGAAHAGGWSPSDVPAGGHNQLPDIVAHVKFKVGDKEVSKEINLGSHYRSPGEAGEELKNFLQSKGIKFYQYSLERVKPKADDKIDSSPATGDMKGSMDTSEPSATGPSTDNYMAKDNDPEHGPSMGGKFVKEDPYFKSLQQMVERQLQPTMDLDAWVDNFQNADPNKYHQFKNKTPEKKK